MMKYNSSKKKKKKKQNTTPIKNNAKNTNKITFVERNIGFSLEIPDNWVEIKKSSYENLGIADNTLFAFVIDEFTTFIAMFSGFADKRKYNKIFSKIGLNNQNILYKKEVEYDKTIIRYLVIDGGGNKVLNAFAFINGMIIDFTINLSQNSKIFDNNKLNQDSNFKILEKVLSNIKITTPINPPIFISKEKIDLEEPVPVKTVVAKEKTTAQKQIEIDCKYKNVVIPDYYFKYVYNVNNDDVILSVIGDEVIFSGLKDEFVFVKDDNSFAKKIHRTISIYWDDLAKYDVGYNKLNTKSYWSMKNRDSYLLLPMNEESLNVLSGIFNEIVMSIEEESKEDYFKYVIFPNFEGKEKNSLLNKKTIEENVIIPSIVFPEKEIKDDDIDSVVNDNISSSNKEETNSLQNDNITKNDASNEDNHSDVINEELDDVKQNRYYIDLEPIFNRGIKINKDVLNKYAIDLKDTVIKNDSIKEEEENNEVSNIYLMDFEKIFNDGIEINKDRLKELEQKEDDSDNKNEIVTEHIVVYGNENRYAIDLNGDPNVRNEIKKKREFDIYEYNLEDYEEYYHNISGHGLFKFMFPKGSGIKVLRDFNVFDIQNYGVLSYRVFLFKCDTYDVYLKKLDDWMKKNFESNNYALLDKYESNANRINVKTYILNNGRFYKIAYLYGYLVAISSVNNDEKLMNANIALENLQVGKPDNQFIESYDRKMNTIYLLQEQKIPYNIDLPPIKSSYEVNGKTFDEVAKRAIVLSIVCNFASDIVNNTKKKYLKDSKKFFNNLLDTFHVRDAMTREEKELFNKMDKDLAMQISWQFEGNLILMWCLGLIEEIPFPDVLVDPDEITSIVSSCSSYKEFTEKCLFRDVQDVLDLADLIYRYDWYCVDCESKGLEPSINSEVVIERHRAINWLLTNEEWDNVEINT